MNKETKENTKPPSKKIPYTKPTITCVKLDPKQAVLGACKVYQQGGAWVDATNLVCLYNTGGGGRATTTNCNTGARGQLTVSFASVPEFASAGS